MLAVFCVYKAGCNMNCSKCFWQSGKCTHPKPEKRIEAGVIKCRGYDSKGVLLSEFTKMKKEISGLVR